jgi:NAD(P)-dependent dehydrogenase (short-subunit alcohol dehydrogenase family)
MKVDLKDQVAIVTGAGRGFGRSIAERIASEGAKVVVTSRSLDQLEETVKHIRLQKGEAIAVAGDVTNRDDVEKVAGAALERFGKISILISNAGVPGPFGPIWDVDPDTWWDDFTIHVRGMLLYSKAVLPSMIEHKEGCIITVSALAATVIAPNMSAYAVAKSAQVRITEHLAAELKNYGIYAFAIEPGTVVTDMAKRTIANPDAKRWVPGMVERLGKLRDETDPGVGLAKCAELCIKLASGKYNALSGKYIDVRENIDEKLNKEM